MTQDKQVPAQDLEVGDKVVLKFMRGTEIVDVSEVLIEDKVTVTFTSANNINQELVLETDDLVSVLDE